MSQAALFSAILTAFLVDSKNLLQQDPADSTVALLLIIARNQISGGSESSTLVEPPPFSPTTSALWVNGLWFASLSLSLATALVAMLSKEWLTAYTASLPRPAHTHALLRQARFDGLNSWWALHIIAILPTLLHLSLLLFALGLVVYLWTLDVIVAAVTGAIVALTLAFYLGTTLLGAIIPFCPFVTEISLYLQQIFSTRLGKWTGIHQHREDRSRHFREGRNTTTMEDIRAISWLAENARDPMVVDCSYQALAGLRLPPDISDHDGQSTNSIDNWRKSLGRIFPTMLTRFGAVVRDGAELASTRGANLARYTRALVDFAAFLDHSEEPRSQKPHDEASPEPRNGISSRLESFKLLSYSDSSALSPNVQSRAKLALEALDNVWRDEHPPFSADAYAFLTAAELRLVVLNGDAIPSQQNVATPVISNLEPTSIPDASIINVTSLPQQHIPLATLQATYTRSLIRAAVQLRYHSDGRTPISTLALSNLLDGLSIAARCAVINSDVDVEPRENQPSDQDDVSPHLPAKNKTPLSFIVPVFSFEHYLRPTDLTRGPLGAVIRVLESTAPSPHSTGMSSSMNARFKVRLAAARALAALAPVVLRRWMLVKVSRSAGNTEEAITTPDPLTWPDVDARVDASKLETVITNQLLLVVRTVGPFIERAGAVTLIELVLAEMNRIATLTPYSAFFALRRRAAQDFIPLLEYASRVGNGNEGSAPLNATTKAHILNLLTFETPGKSQIPRIHISAQHVPLLLRVAQGLPNHTTLIGSVLKYVIARVRETKNSEYLRIFTRSNQGFSALVAIESAHHDNIENIVNAILQITHVATIGANSPDSTHTVIDISAMPGFLHCISVVAKHTTETVDKHTHRHLGSFGRNIVVALRRIDPLAAQMVLEHGALDQVMLAIQTQREKSGSDLQLSLSEGSSKIGAQLKSNEYLLTQLHVLKTEDLPKLALAKTGTKEDGRPDGELE